MTSLDELANEYIADLTIPAGSGVERVMRDGRRRRHRRRTTTLAAATFGVVAVGALGVVALRTDRRSQDTLVQVDAPSQTNPDGTSRPLGTASQPIAVSINTDSLPMRDGTEVPEVPTPTLAGWTIQSTAVAVTDRFSDAGIMTQYSLRSNDSVLTLDVSSGQADIDGEEVTLDRGDRSVDAALKRDREGLWTLTWNERPGANTGTAVWMRGPDRTELIDTAAAVAFVDKALVGAEQPEFVPTGPSWEPVFRGTTSGREWSVGQAVDGSIVIEIEGRSPAITSSVTRVSDIDISATTVSKDGIQITAVEVPADAQSVSIISQYAEPVVLPLSTLGGAGRQVAVAPIPAQRDAAVIAVTLANGNQTNIGLPPAPQQGWTTSRRLTAAS